MRWFGTSLYDRPGTAIIHFLTVEAMAVYSLYICYNAVASLIISQTVHEVVEKCVTDVVVITATTTTTTREDSSEGQNPFKAMGKVLSGKGATTTVGAATTAARGATTTVGAATTAARANYGKKLGKNTSTEQEQSPWPEWALSPNAFPHCDRNARHICRTDGNACMDARRKCHKRRLAKSASSTSGIEAALKETCDPGQKALWTRVEIRYHCMHKMVASLCKKRHDGHSYPYQACYDLDNGNRDIDVEEAIEFIDDSCPYAGFGMLSHNLFFMIVNYCLLICCACILGMFFYRLIKEGGCCWSFGRGAYMTLTWDLEQQLAYKTIVGVMAFGAFMTILIVVYRLGLRILTEFIVQIITFWIGLFKLLLVDVPSFDYNAERFKIHTFYRPALDLITKSNDAFGVRLNDALWADNIEDSSALRRFWPQIEGDGYLPVLTNGTNNDAFAASQKNPSEQIRLACEQPVSRNSQ